MAFAECCVALLLRYRVVHRGFRRYTNLFGFRPERREQGESESTCAGHQGHGDAVVALQLPCEHDLNGRVAAGEEVAELIGEAGERRSRLTRPNLLAMGRHGA